MKSDRLEELKAHPTVKPLPLVVDAIKDCTARGDVVLDTFCGYGTTLIAAERTGRTCIGVELDPRYVDAAIRRWQRFTKRDAILDGTSCTFDELAKRRNRRAA